MTISGIQSASNSTYITVPNLSIDIGNTTLAYRDLGPRDGVPVVLLNHWGAVLDNFDPRIVDGLASRHRVIATDYRGVGGSGGTAPLTVDEMARDAIALISALGFEQVNLFGFSLGGFVAQDITLKAPGLVRKLILTGTGPAGGKDIDKVGAIAQPLIQKGISEGKDPKFFLFFTSSDTGRQAAGDFLNRLQERQADRDKEVTPQVFLRQLQAIEAWGRQAPQDLGSIHVPVLVTNGDQDIMVPTENSHDLAHRIPNAQLVIYEDAGHGGIFQNHADFVSKALAFLKD
ncbi:alpha/beta fold hydrolase [Pseudomonas fluorescens]|uniref:alpha/beta fold hydrolase n=1 Tax=Pseudomonas fluorescens TaxID=294 RepID=UPI0010D016C7|nr:alpha/beta hydrolase [Pseudomonas fluorescens]TCV66220.1 pimeloyl-ACP methyl ester carboxylesterase [Pseudomonas fluorescens]